MIIPWIFWSKNNLRALFRLQINFVTLNTSEFQMKQKKNNVQSTVWDATKRHLSCAHFRYL